MTKEEYLKYLEQWETAVLVLAAVSLGIGILNYIFYKISFVSKKTLKEKFDLSSAKEIKRLMLSHTLVAFAIFFLLNMAEYEIVQLHYRWFIIRLFLSLSIAVLYGYIAQLVLKFYYPGQLEKKLKKLRYTPRVHPENGNELKLLSEAEEDAYLDEGMQAEEDVFSVDYDVWIDEKTGYTQIEKYKGHLSALECDRCGFQTLKLKKEEIIKPSTDTTDGELYKEYHCSYCGRIKKKTVVLSHKIKEDAESGVLIQDPLKHDANISVIKLEIHGTDGEVKEFDFISLAEAKKFLSEFEYEKVEQH